MNLGLRGKILLSAALIVLAATAAITVSSSLFFTDRQIQAHLSRSEAIAEGLALQLERILALGIGIGDLHGFEEQCAEAVEHYPGLSYAMVTSLEAQILFHSDRNRMGKALSSPVLLDALQQGLPAIDDRASGNHVVQATVEEASGRKVASVLVGFPEASIDKERRELLLLTLAAAIGVMAVGLVLLFLVLSRTVIRPLTGFMQAIQQVRRDGEGLTTARVPIQGEDELQVLANSFNDLLEQIAAREQQLIVAKEDAEAASRAKSEFLAIISHEIRTPLNTVLGMNDLLLAGSLDEKHRRHALTAKGAGESLLRLIDDILDYSRIESGKVELVRYTFDLRDLVADTIAPFAARAAGKGLSLTASVDETLPDRVIGDLGRLRQILSHLLDNAVKFTDSGAINLAVSPAGERIRFTVSDTGIGIDPGYLPHLYDSFSKADSSYSRRHGGTGLGLAIVKRLCDLMGADIEASSRPGKGTTFWFELLLPAAPASRNPAAPPIRPAPASLEASGASPPVTQESTTDSPVAEILLVEDHPDNQELIRLYLEGAPYRLMVAENGLQALNLYKEGDFDLILMDWQLPLLDGLDTTQLIRELERRTGRKRVPIIAVTAHAAAADRDRCLAAGMDAYLSKPFGRDQLLKLVAEQLG